MKNLTILSCLMLCVLFSITATAQITASGSCDLTFEGRGRALLENSELAPSEKLVVSTTITNRGKMTSVPTTISFYLGRNDAKGMSDLLLGTAKLGALKTNETASKREEFLLPRGVEAGTDYFLHTVIDSGKNKESDITNNHVARQFMIKGKKKTQVDTGITKGNTVTVGASDLMFDGGVSTNMEVVKPGDVVVVKSNIVNKGANASVPTRVSFWLGNTKTPTENDQLLGTKDLPVIAAGKAMVLAENVTITKLTKAGNYFVHARIESGRNKETNFKNNRGTTRLTVQGVRKTVKQNTKDELNMQNPPPRTGGVQPPPPVKDGKGKIKTDGPTRPHSDFPKDKANDGKTVYESRVDLLISNLAMTNRKPAPGKKIKLITVVQNRGSMASTPATITYFWSNSDKPTRNDIKLKTVDIPTLKGSSDQRMTQSIKLPKEIRGGGYIHATINSPKHSESSTDNNTNSLKVMVN